MDELVKTFEEYNDQLIKAYEEYIKLLGDELNDLAPLAQNRGWKSTRYEAGKSCREKIKLLKAKLHD